MLKLIKLIRYTVEDFFNLCNTRVTYITPTRSIANIYNTLEQRLRLSWLVRKYDFKVPNCLGVTIVDSAMQLTALNAIGKGNKGVVGYGVSYLPNGLLCKRPVLAIEWAALQLPTRDNLANAILLALLHVERASDSSDYKGFKGGTFNAFKLYFKEHDTLSHVYTDIIDIAIRRLKVKNIPTPDNWT